MARGLTDKQIAREWGLAVSSVRTYLGRLAHKAGVQRRAGLAQWAAQWAAQAEVRINDEPLPGA